MNSKVNRYRFTNGTVLATGPRPSFVPGWAASNMRVPLSRADAASAIRHARSALAAQAVKVMK